MANGRKEDREIEQRRSDADMRQMRSAEELFTDRRAIPPFATLRAFETFGRLGGVRKAAQELSVHHSVVSRHLHALEQWLGVPLFDRTASVPRLNDMARRYHEIISSSIIDIARATRDIVYADSVRKYLLIWCVPGFATRWLAPNLDDFAQRHPEIEVELRPTDHAPDLRADEADADIRFVRDIADAAPAPGVEWLRIARPKVFPVASPVWLAQHPFSGQARDFPAQRLLHEENDEEWRGWFTANGVAAGPRISGPRLYHANMTLDAARRGQGIALANPFLIGDDLADGQLQVVGTPEGRYAEAEIGAYTLAVRQETIKRPTIARFQAWLLERAGAFLAGEGGRPQGLGPEPPIAGRSSVRAGAGTKG